MFSLEWPHRGHSNEYKQYTIFNLKKENHPKLSHICSYGMFSKGLKNEFQTAMVNKPSVFEPLKFYCTMEKLTSPTSPYTLAHTDKMSHRHIIGHHTPYFNTVNVHLLTLLHLERPKLIQFWLF